ncbi:hypothetical protein [Brevundimonas variabilis]|uniref:Uncharacterized protein n=1 Tax=Brevundimonas variabilis TaxID=74312 RepID=A0A7W9FDL8_9CAUL|nr:hypothetical protein [Brevundimonas variabilis]MBB5745541.1 hypothetical protein [Brevundimonas variabilis]
MLPPWIAFPDLGRTSIAWRRGDGADYLDDFHRMLDALSPVERDAYEAAHPEQDEWYGFYAYFRERPWS